MTLDNLSSRPGDFGRYLDWELGLATHHHSDDTQQTPRWHFVASGILLAILAALFAPGDGGILLNHWVVVIVLAHVGFYLLNYATHPREHTAVLTRITNPVICFLFSIGCVIVITVALSMGAIPEYFGLAD